MRILKKLITHKDKLLFLLIVLPSILLLLMSIWSISFGFISGYLGFLLILLGIFFGIKLKSFKIILIIPLIWILINTIFILNTSKTYESKRIEYFNKVMKNEDIGFFAKCNIYGLNIIMSIVALPIYPEVALESLCLIFPTKNKVRYFHSNFFLESKRICKALSPENYRDNVIVRWNVSDYILGNTEARYALALNPCELNMINKKNELFYSAKVKVKYPTKSEVVLIKKPVRIVIEEGLFRYLQDVGWFHPYDAIWIGKKNYSKHY